MEQEAQAIKEGADTADIKDPDEVIAEMDEDVPAEADEELESEKN